MQVVDLKRELKDLKYDTLWNVTPHKLEEKDIPQITHNALEKLYSAILTWHLVSEVLLISSLGLVVRMGMKFASCHESHRGC